MKKPTVEARIGEIVKDMGLCYRCESWMRANEVLDKFKRQGQSRTVCAPEGLSLPMCLHTQPVSGRFSLHNGELKDAPECIISFADAMPLDFKGDEAQAISERLKGLAVDFIRRVNESGYFRPLDGDIPYRIAFDKFDANLCLVTITPTIREAQGICIEE